MSWMEVRVLGPVELVSGGRQLALAPMPRRLLAALATRAGETCSADLLVEALWGEVPPASGAKLVQVYSRSFPRRSRNVMRSAPAVPAMRLS